MKTKTLFFLAGISSMISGICILGGKIFYYAGGEITGEVMDFFSPFFGLFATLGIYLWHRKRAGKLGDLAFIFFFPSLSLVMSMDFFAAFILPQFPEGTGEALLQGPAGPVFAVIGIAFLISEIVFAVSVIRARVFSRVAAVLFLTGLISVPMMDVFSPFLMVAGSALAAAGLCWWGVELVTIPAGADE